MVAAALQADAHVLHLMSHGDTTPDELGFWSDDEKTSILLPDLAEHFAADKWGIRAATVFADCCSSGQGRFVQAVRDCIEEPVTYIGATRMIDWRESTTFASAFYGAYFKDRGRGKTPAERGARAAVRAIEGYKSIVDGPCPFTVKNLTPSRHAPNS